MAFGRMAGWGIIFERFFVFFFFTPLKIDYLLGI
jgi:hypothetical protein